MRKRADVQRLRTGEARGPSRGETPLPKRWPWVVAIMVCVAIGLALLERLSRPVDRPDPDQAVLPAEPRPKAAKAPPICSVPATDQELIAQTNKIGDRLVEEFPDDPRAITLAGHIGWALDERAKAVASWEKCTQRFPGFAAAWAALGMDAFKQGDFENAAQCLEKAHRLSPQTSEGELFMLVDALMNTGKPEKVVAVLEPLHRAQPRFASAALVLGHAYLQLKEYAKAKTELLEAVAHDPRSAKAHFALAQAFSRLGDEPNARKHRETYAKLKSEEISAGERQRVGRLKSDLVELRPQAARLLASAARVFAIHGRDDEAEQIWVASLAVDPNNGEARSMLAALYSEQGRDEEAREVSRGSGRAQAPDRKQ